MKRSELKIGSFYTFSTKQTSLYENQNREVRGIGQLKELRPKGFIRLTLFKKEDKKIIESGYIEVKEEEILNEIKKI